MLARQIIKININDVIVVWLDNETRLTDDIRSGCDCFYLHNDNNYVVHLHKCLKSANFNHWNAAIIYGQ